MAAADTLLSPPTISGRSEGIDLLRGLFALQVLVFAHLVFWSDVVHGDTPDILLQIGRAFRWTFQRHAELNPAVLAFIVLSGYCIHRNGLRAGSSVGMFALRRCFRILPVFVFAAFLGIFGFQLSASLDPKMASALTGTSAIAPLCVAAKLSTLATVAPLAHPCSFLGNAPLLTVAAEIVLYAMYGALFVLGSSRLILALCAGSVIIGLAISALNLRFPLLYNWWQNSSAISFLPYWWIGAAAVRPAVRTFLRRRWVWLLLGWLVLTGLSHLEATAVAAEVRKLSMAGLVAMLVVRIDDARLPSNPLSMIGKAGYSLYAVHAPVCVFLLLSGWNWWQTFLGAMAAGVVSYVALERPLDDFGRSFTRRMAEKRLATS